MTDPITIWLPGKVIGKGRPRFGGGNVYTPSKTRSYEQSLAWAAKVAMQGKRLIEGPVQVEVDAFFVPPESWSKKKKDAAMLAEIYPTGKPDADNILKIAADSLNKIVWIDDAQIVTAEVFKRYAFEAGLKIRVKAL